MVPEDRTALIDRYLSLIADGTSDIAEIEALLDPSYRFIERPNLIAPSGSARDRATTLAGIPQGRALLAWQRFEVRDHAVVGEERVITRAVWEGEVAIDAGPLRAGSRLRADIAMFFEVRDGRIVSQENFDCYSPLHSSDA